jgi:hypothetical protein
VTNPEILVMLNQKARELSVAVGNLHRYELQVEKGQHAQNDDFYAALKTDVKNAQSALRLIRAAIDGKSAAELTAQDIQDIRRVAQEEAIGAIAEALNWTWEAANNRWLTPAGTFYTATGEQIG